MLPVLDRWMSNPLIILKTVSSLLVTGRVAVTVNINEEGKPDP
jgi:hypothetical protein